MVYLYLAYVAALLVVWLVAAGVIYLVHKNDMDGFSEEYFSEPDDDSHKQG